MSGAGRQPEQQIRAVHQQPQYLIGGRQSSHIDEGIVQGKDFGLRAGGSVSAK